MTGRLENSRVCSGPGTQLCLDLLRGRRRLCFYICKVPERDSLWTQLLRDPGSLKTGQRYARVMLGTCWGLVCTQVGIMPVEAPRLEFPGLEFDGGKLKFKGLKGSELSRACVL